MPKRIALLVASIFAGVIPIFGQSQPSPATPPAPLQAEVSYPGKSPFLHGDQAFPATSFSTGDPSQWHVYGSANGNRLGTRAAVDPVTGAAVTELWFNGTNPKKRWLGWQTTFPAPLCREGMTGITLEIYPLTPIPAGLRVEFGLPLAIKDIGPAFASSVGNLTPGRWNRLTISRGSNRHPYPAGIRLVIDISHPDVPLGQEVRFLVRDFQPAPGSVINTNPPSAPLETHPPVRAAYLQLTSPVERSLGDASTLSLDIAVARAIHARLSVNLVPASGSGGISPTAPVEIDLRPPVTRISITRRPGTMAAPFEGAALLSCTLSSDTGAALLQTLHPFQVRFFNDKTFQDGLTLARGRVSTLRQRAADLASRGILTEEPKITLEVASLFLTQFIPDDYERQKERSIALTLLGQVSRLLDKATGELDERADGRIHERPVPHRYDPTRPIEIRHARLYQDNQPLLLFGPQGTSSFQEIPLLSKLGFNSVEFETNNGELFKPNSRLKNAVQEAADDGLAVHLLFSTHYIRELAHSSLASHVMLPYDILAPDTRPILDRIYHQVLPPLNPLTNLISVGTANEPGYSIRPQAAAYETAFREWLAGRNGGQIDQLNNRWHTHYASVADITLKDVFAAAKSNPAIAYDWECFRAYILGTHFRFMRDEVLHSLPDRMVWVKKFHTFGFGQIDPEVVFDQGATIHDWSNTSPLQFDYDRGIDPSAPLSCSEWKLVPGFTPATLDTDPAVCSLAMFENYARGLVWGTVWKWPRRDWRAMGDNSTFTRYPTAMETISRTSYRLQQLAPIFDRLATLGDGPVALLFDKASLLHQGSAAYLNQPETGFESLYWKLNQNSAGVRILHAGRFVAADLMPRRLIAAGTANALDTTTVLLLRDWVSRGGTLWLTAPGTLALDPWGAPYAGENAARFADLIRAASTPGQHPLGKGLVVVDPTWEGWRKFLTGPVPFDANTGTPIIQDVETRLTLTADGLPEYLYVLNRSQHSYDVLLKDAANGQPWTIPDKAVDIWNEDPGMQPHGATLSLPPHRVVLFDLRADAATP